MGDGAQLQRILLYLTGIAEVLSDVEDDYATGRSIIQPRQERRKQDAVNWFDEDGLMTAVHDPVKVRWA